VECLRFTSKLLADYTPAELDELCTSTFGQVDLDKTSKLTRKVTEAMEQCQFNTAIEEIRNFTWHTFCDSYVEAVKDRLYKAEIHGKALKLAAQQTLHEVLYTILQLLSPITPHLAEEIYQTMYAENKGFKSLQISPWPKFNAAIEDEQTEKRGDLVISLISEVRRDKAEKRLPLNTPIKKLIIYAGDHSAAEAFTNSQNDIMGACKVETITVLSEEGNGRDLIQYPHVHFVAEHATRTE
jgi:valyl-tRNA synthetase